MRESMEHPCKACQVRRECWIRGMVYGPGEVPYICYKCDKPEKFEKARKRDADKRGEGAAAGAD